LIDMRGDSDAKIIPCRAYKMIMIAKDRFSGHILLVSPLETKQAAEYAVAIGPTFTASGSPLHCTSDQGSEWRELFANTIAILRPRTKIVMTRPGHPAANRTTEKTVRDLKDKLRILRNQHATIGWSVLVSVAAEQLNCTPRRDRCRLSSHKFMFGEPPVSLESMKIHLEGFNISEWRSKLQTEQEG